MNNSNHNRDNWVIETLKVMFDVVEVIFEAGGWLIELVFGLLS